MRNLAGRTSDSSVGQLATVVAAVVVVVIVVAVAVAPAAAPRLVWVRVLAALTVRLSATFLLAVAAIVVVLSSLRLARVVGLVSRCGRRVGEREYEHREQSNQGAFHADHPPGVGVRQRHAAGLSPRRCWCEVVA